MFFLFIEVPVNIDFESLKIIAHLYQDSFGYFLAYYNYSHRIEFMKITGNFERSIYCDRQIMLRARRWRYILRPNCCILIQNYALKQECFFLCNESSKYPIDTAFWKFVFMFFVISSYIWFKREENEKTDSIVTNNCPCEFFFSF